MAMDGMSDIGSVPEKQPEIPAGDSGFRFESSSLLHFLSFVTYRYHTASKGNSERLPSHVNT